jgi:hypothetical protein
MTGSTGARAEEARTVAHQLTDFTAKASMLRIAEEYDGLAEHAPAAGGKKDQGQR